jgi:hypothetical protein
VRLSILLAATAAAMLAAWPPNTGASRAERPWPPPPKRGHLFVHYGEEHWNDLDGLRILPKVIRDSARYEPDLVSMSGDKDDDGTVENLERWKQLMGFYDRAGIPYFAAVGNHDRKAHPGFPNGVDPFGDLSNYAQVFADRPYPFGDSAPIDDPRFQPRERPPADPPGASSHYAFEYGRVRWIYLDNSCFSFANCDQLQNPPFPDSEGNSDSYDFLAAEAARAQEEGDLAFVVMHMPTQDPRPGHTQPTPSDHTMGEGTSPDNAVFERAAAEAGIDAVLAGHIKGQWTYRASGIPYYIDGGAGGEVYVGDGEETGVDYGYWHGYRLIHVRGDRVRTWTVPVFERDGIEIHRPARVRRGKRVHFAAAGQQPTKEGPNVLLELRRPDSLRPNAENLPAPARIWRTADPEILAPVRPNEAKRAPAGSTTHSGLFKAICPGTTSVTVTSGWEQARAKVTVRGPGGNRCAAPRR